MDIKTKFIIGLSLSVLLMVGVGFGWYKVNSLISESEKVKTQNTYLQTRQEITEDLYQNVLKRMEDRDVVFQSYITRLEKVSEKHIEVVNSFSRETKKEQFSRVAKKRPETLEKLINKRIDDLFKCIEKTTGKNLDVLCHFDNM